MAAAEGQNADLPAENRRSIKNFFKKPKFHLKYTNYFIGGGLLSLAGTAIVIQRKLEDVDVLLNSPEATGLGGQVQIYDALAGVTQVAFIGFASFVVFACILALIMSHRIAGPMIAIVAYIDELRKGNYNYARELRKRDELKPIHEGLQALAADLKGKSRR